MSQTTQGIWLAKSADIDPCTIVLDLEGSDGVERGEDDTLFEKQSALLALAVSDIVLINMWCIDIGCEQRGGRPLLRIVFEKILSLKNGRKTTLLFVLRDKTKGKMEVLERCLRESIEKIYDSIPKTEAHMNTTLDTFFNVEVTALANYEYQEADFKQQVEALRERFNKSTSPGRLAGDQTNKVPASHIFFSIQSIWKTIKANKDLDLPAHKIMVSSVRCDEIIKEQLLHFDTNEDWRCLQSALKSDLVPDFGRKLGDVIDECLLEYDARATNCNEGVRITKRHFLLEKVLQIVRPANDTMIEYVHASACNVFKEAFSKAVHNRETYMEVSRTCTKGALVAFSKGCKEMENGHETYDTSRWRHRLERDMDDYINYVGMKDALGEALAASASAAAAATTAREVADTAANEARTAAKRLADAQDAAGKLAAEGHVAALEQITLLKDTLSKVAAIAKTTADNAAASKAAAESAAAAAVAARKDRDSRCVIQ